MTTLALLALAAPRAPDLGPEGKAAREKGLAWLSSSSTDDTVQGAALKLVLWRRLAQPASEQELFEDRPKVFLVFGDQDLDPWSGRGRGHEVASSAGSRILNVLPAPGALSSSMRPPWSAMIP